MSKIFDTSYGTVEVRTAMFDIDGTTLQEGVEVKGEEIGLIEVYGWRDIDDLTTQQVESLIKINERWNY
jgi:hypothetical protein